MMDADSLEVLRQGEPLQLEIFVANPFHLEYLVNSLEGNVPVSRLVLELSHTAESNHSFADLLRYLEQTQSLREIELTFDNDREHAYSEELVRQVLRSLTRNASLELSSLNSVLVKAPCLELMELLNAQSHCIKHLEFRAGYGAGQEVPDSMLRCFARQVGTLSVLESVNLSFSSYEHTVLMLNGLRSHSCLRELSTSGAIHEGDGPFVRAVSSLLHSGVRLDTLHLDYIILDTERVEILVQGLESCCSSLVNLSLSLCVVDEADASIGMALARCIRQCQNLRRLELFTVGDSMNIAASILTVTATEVIGSSLQFLRLECSDDNDIRNMLEPLTARGTQLVSLSLSGLTDTTWQQLIQYLPRIRCLRTLRFSFRLEEMVTSLPFLRALSQNGSLHEVSLDASPDDPFFSDLDLRWIETLCNRNRCAPAMLQRPDIDSIDSTLCADARTPLPLIPSLCRVVVQTPRMAPSFLLASLLVSDGDDHRIRSQTLEKRESFDLR
jgi:hypothetical protein